MSLSGYFRLQVYAEITETKNFYPHELLMDVCFPIRIKCFPNSEMAAIATMMLVVHPAKSVVIFAALDLKYV